MTRLLLSAVVLATAAAAFAQDAISPADASPAEPINILFVNIDDMNDWTEPTSLNPQIQTPQLERLAAMGTYFTNAHCNYPRCVQSRSSYMTGLYPETFIGRGVEGAVDGHEIKDAQGVVEQAEALGTKVMENYFKDYGYKTYMIGKIYHGRAHDGIDVDGGYGGGSAGRPAESPKFEGKGTGTDWGVYAEGEASDADMGDYQNTSWVIDQLQNHPADGAPFFMALGFRLPHVPWYIPKKWADLYPADEALWKEPFFPDDFDDIPSAGRDKVLNGFPDIVDTESAYYVGEAGWREITQTYAGSISFVDDQIGRLLDGLANSPHADNTVIVVFSDHGYHLGNKNIFTKHNLWDRANHVPLFFAGPGVPAGQMLDQTVELVDVYPTLLALAGLPANPANEGDNLVPLMQDPAMAWDNPAHLFHGSGDDQAVVLGDWRYIRYDTADDSQQELYNVADDPYEVTNLAFDPAHETKRAEMEALTVPRPWMNLTINSTGEGTISQDPPGPTYDKGDVVTLTAQPAPGWRFDHWDNHASGTDPVTTVKMKPWHRTVEAYFVEQ
ncbi:MAG: sulfatase-like hydrolase/transferase [Planctomycetota bacterium]